MAVERDLRDARLRRELVDADGERALLVEHARGGVEDPLACRRGIERLALGDGQWLDRRREDESGRSRCTEWPAPLMIRYSTRGRPSPRRGRGEAAEPPGRRRGSASATRHAVQQARVVPGRVVAEVRSIASGRAWRPASAFARTHSAPSRGCPRGSAPPTPGCVPRRRCPRRSTGTLRRGARAPGRAGSAAARSRGRARRRGPRPGRPASGR